MDNQLPLFPSDTALRQPRADLTPNDLVVNGWWIQPYFDSNLWVARKVSAAGGSLYSPAFADPAILIDYVRQLYIRKEPIT